MAEPKNEEKEQDRSWFDGMGELFGSVAGSALNSFLEDEKEKPSGDAVSASPVVHQQTSAAVQPTGTMIGQTVTPLDWARNNWLMILLAVIVVVLLILFLVK